ncbi:MAG: hypothetical protein G01um101416_508 [Microgenomates group bacterium Gr01-1014_16]|nr:MAG: hypothetical protein G01um101416_508 [Microgenomates group bacterium Gr01-1014_16]
MGEGAVGAATIGTVSVESTPGVALSRPAIWAAEIVTSGNLGSGLVDGDGSPVQHLAVELGYGLFGFFFGAHFHKPEAFGAAGEFVGNDRG